MGVGVGVGEGMSGVNTVSKNKYGACLFSVVFGSFALRVL